MYNNAVCVHTHGAYSAYDHDCTFVQLYINKYSRVYVSSVEAANDTVARGCIVVVCQATKHDWFLREKCTETVCINFLTTMYSVMTIY